MFPFKYDRYTSRPVINYPPTINVDKLYANNIKEKMPSQVVFTFDDYILEIEKQRGYKCSRQERRKLYKKFVKRNKK